MKYIHNKRGISPEDLRATIEGGFKESQILEWGNSVGFNNNYFFQKQEFLSYLCQRFLEKVCQYKLKNTMYTNKNITKLLVSFLNHVDHSFANISKIYQNNLIRVVWGYRKL